MQFLNGIINEAHRDYRLQAQILKTALHPVHPKTRRLEDRFDLKRMAVEITNSKPKEQGDKDLIHRPFINKTNVSTSTDSPDKIIQSRSTGEKNMQGFVYENYMVNEAIYCPKDGKPCKR
jgi:hypothetical protein